MITRFYDVMARNDRVSDDFVARIILEPRIRAFGSLSRIKLHFAHGETARDNGNNRAREDPHKGPAFN